MKLYGFIKPYDNYSFSIPIYSDNNYFYFHKLKYNLRVEAFEMVKNISHSICKTNNYLEIEKGDFGAIVFIGSNKKPLIDYANQIALKIRKKYSQEIIQRPNLINEINDLNRRITYRDLSHITSFNDLYINKTYSVLEAATLVKKTSYKELDASVNIDVRLSSNLREVNRKLKGAIFLPHGTGKEVRVLALVNEAKQDEAREAGADHVGMDEYIKKIEEGWADIDVIIATPDSMGKLSKLGRFLGPRGLMPNPKSGTVTMDVANAVKTVKAGQINFKADKFGIIHTRIGRVSFDKNKLSENASALISKLIELNPLLEKYSYIESIYMSSPKSPILRIDSSETDRK